MPLSHSIRCIFVHIPKTGGSSIEQGLGMFGDWRVEDADRLFGKIRSPNLKNAGFHSAFLQHLTMPEIQRVSPGAVRDGYYSFSIVRNPWDRMVSVYSRPDPNMVEQASDEGIELLGLSFDTFLERVGNLSHIHVLPQYIFVTDGSGRTVVDFVGRFESLARDFARVCETLGIVRSLPHANASPSRNSKDYRGYYTRETRAIVAERYSRDLELFGYEF